MTKPHVAAAIAARRAAQSARTGITAERVLVELARIAFADPGAYAEWGPEGMSLVDKARLSPDERVAVAEIVAAETAARNGMPARRARFRLHDKLRALDALARHFKLYGAHADKVGPGSARRPDADPVARADRPADRADGGRGGGVRARAICCA